MPKRKSGADKIADILAKFNIQTDEPVEVPESNYNSTNALAMFAKVPEHFVMGECMNCGSKFAHNQPIPAGTRVGYCGDTCRKQAFEKSTGIKWGAVTSSREPWDGDPPMIITPEQYANLEKIADWFTRNRTTLEIAAPEPTLERQTDEDSQEPEYLAESQYPTSQTETPDQWFESLPLTVTSEQESQYLAGVRTNSQPSPVPSTSTQTDTEDAIFDFE